MGVALAGFGLYILIRPAYECILTLFLQLSLLWTVF